jgi:streptogramin lyase
MGEEVYKRNIITVLIVLTIMSTAFNIPKVGLSQTSFKMPYKTFPVQPYSYNSSLITDGAIKYLSLPPNSLPMGIIYHNYTNKVWIALHWNRSIVSVDIATMNVTFYPMPLKIDENYGQPLPWTLAITPDNCIWFSIRDHMLTPYHPPEYVPYLGMLDTANNIITIYYTPVSIGGGCDVKFYNNYIWFLGTHGFAKINYITREIVETYAFDLSGDGFMEVDSYSNAIWISSVVRGLVVRFNVLSDVFDINLTGFDRPLGIEVDENYVYVAENSQSKPIGTIAKVSKVGYSITRLQTATRTNEGPYHVLKDSYGNLWWTDNSNHVGVFYYLNPNISIVYNSRPYCLFMTEVPGKSIWFSAVGSAYVGVVEPPKSADVNRDCIVNMRDITAIILDFNAVQGDSRYKPECDLDNNGIVNMRDVTIAILCFNKRTS